MELNLAIEDASLRGALYGSADQNLRTIRAAFGVRITARNSTIRLVGEADDVRRAAQAIESIQRSLRETGEVSDAAVAEAIERASLEEQDNNHLALRVFLPSATVSPRGVGQERYVTAIQNNDLTFCLGPAGTGKTYLAVAVAVARLKKNEIKRIVLVRPAVEAGERLGYLPGDMQAKVNPYLRPLFDAMHDMMTFDQIKRFMQNDVIEVVPLAFMRGRTLNKAVIILDEAQNATSSQMLMFLTRLGNNSCMVVTGDDSQSDLESGKESGLIDAVQRLDGVEGIAVVRLEQCDIVRHELVQRVVQAYDKNAAVR